MATAKHTRRPAGSSASRAKPRKSPIRHVPSKGLVVATHASFPQSAEAKVVVAKHIVQSVVAAHDTLQGENYDIHWPLNLVVELLEQATDQLDLQELGRKS